MRPTAALAGAYRRLRDDYRVSAPLVLVGGKGWIYEDIFRAIDDLRLTGFVRHLSGVPDVKLAHLYRAAGVAALIMLIAGDIGSAGEDILVQGSALMSLSYSREQESAADRRSVDLMLATGKDPVAIVRFFQLLQDKFGKMEGPNILSTHPATAGRMEAVKAYAEEAKARVK